MAVFITGGQAAEMVNYVAWLQSDGNQYILLDYKPNQNTRVVCDCQATAIDSGGSFPWGVRTSYNNTAFAVALTTTQTFHNYGNVYKFANYADPYERMTIDANKNAATFTGTQSVTITLAVATFTAQYNLALFSCVEGGSVLTGDAAWNGKVWSYQIYENDVLLYDLWPCYDPDGVACLYDKVEKKYYYNQGSGVFYTAETPAQQYYWEKYTVGERATYTTEDMSSSYLANRTSGYVSSGLTYSNEAGYGYRWLMKTYVSDLSNYDPSAYPYFSDDGLHPSTMYHVRSKNYAAAGMYDLNLYSELTITGEESAKGTYISDVASTDPNAYPDNGVQDGYWYVKVVS